MQRITTDRSKFISIFGFITIGQISLGVGRLEKCNICGVEISEEEYYLNEGLCEKCYNENLEKADEFRKVDA